jgi:hypothetical protein
MVQKQITDKFRNYIVFNNLIIINAEDICLKQLIYSFTPKKVYFTLHF